ncbi:MAG TPA: PQQ-dependent sugar dehydrogenase [Streptomyces sp.]|uniref:PQQ-dependent sugar dehydrogenase n=1 Tax=Streptomyces sp. TaxID=1931 RepID=UPI002D34802E|nr:PQQ-dependent sugar dehydrogenase [Streptomyces sp.]HZG06427.1 PQQ-dependent sugar dehydrogenase [Streptomyces sp.]
MSFRRIRTAVAVGATTALAAGLLTAGTGNATSPSLSPGQHGPELSGAPSVPTGISVVSEGWTIPWGMSWLPDGSALITERDTHRVFHLTADGRRTPVGTVPNVRGTGREGGLLGIAVSPDFAADRAVYFFHTSATDNRIARMTFDGTSLDGYETVFTGIGRAMNHNGGRLKFGPDGYLYATTGDTQRPELAQDPEALEGKILRMTTDGRPAPGNPYGTVVYSIGHRNPQGITWDPEGRLWSAEFGENRFDELNLVEPGNNYGWPVCEGACDVPGMTDPKEQWSTGDASPSGVTFADGAVYMAAQRGQRLWRIPVNGEDTGTPEAFYVRDFGRLRTVETVPGRNALWLSTTNCDASGRQPAGSDVVFEVTLE